MASHSLQAMQRSSPEGYLRRDFSLSLLLWPSPTSVYVCVHACTSSPSPAEGMLPSEAGWKRALLEGVVDGGRFPEQVAHGHSQAWPVEGDTQTDSIRRFRALRMWKKTQWRLTYSLTHSHTWKSHTIQSVLCFNAIIYLNINTQCTVCIYQSRRIIWIRNWFWIKSWPQEWKSNHGKVYPEAMKQM